jgi:hypothetical protein
MLTRTDPKLHTSRKSNAGHDLNTALAARAVGGIARPQEPIKRFKTVLVPSCGWPTEASVPKKAKRPVER